MDSVRYMQRFVYERYVTYGQYRKRYNFIDLFAGAGGLSEGFLQAGFNPVAHVEMNEFAAITLETRSTYYYLKSTDNLGIYKKYMSGKITREDFIKQISASIIKTLAHSTKSKTSSSKLDSKLTTPMFLSRATGSDLSVISVLSSA